LSNRIFSELIGSAVLAAVVDPTGYKIAAEREVITLLQRLQLQLNLDVAQEALYQAFINQQPRVARLLSLAVAIGLSQEALTRGSDCSPGGEAIAQNSNGARDHSVVSNLNARLCSGQNERLSARIER
jgi:hypothetical protein